jgi:hypothetical protein
VVSFFYLGEWGGGVESNGVHSALRPPIGLLCQPRVIMRMENLVEWWLAGETEVLNALQGITDKTRRKLFCDNSSAIDLKWRHPGLNPSRRETGSLTTATGLQTANWETIEYWFHVVENIILKITQWNYNFFPCYWTNKWRLVFHIYRSGSFKV